MNSIICYLGGDQTNTWTQKVEIMKTSIPLEDAKKIFELHNIFNREYETLDSENYSYIGLDNLKDEVKFFKQKFKKLNLDEYKNNSEAEDFMEFFIERTRYEN